MQLVLNAQSIEVKTAGAITTNQLEFYAQFIDTIKDAVTPGVQTGQFTNAYTTVVPGPANNTVRVANEIFFFNADTVAATVIVAYVDIAGIRIVKQATLNAGQTLSYQQFEAWTVN